LGHGNIHQHHVRFQALRHQDSFAAVLRFAHDFEQRILLQDAHEAYPHQQVIVGHQHAGGYQRAAHAIGTSGCHGQTHSLWR
jgi:hypothetical protein